MTENKYAALAARLRDPANPWGACMLEDLGEEDAETILSALDAMRTTVDLGGAGEADPVHVTFAHHERAIDGDAGSAPDPDMPPPPRKG